MDASRILVLGRRSRLARALAWATGGQVCLADRAGLWSPGPAPTPAAEAPTPARHPEAAADLERVTRQMASLGDALGDIHSYFDLVAGRILDSRPAAVINCAGFTDVERAESQTGLAMAINAEGPARLAAACARSGSWLVHLSTDYVFDGLSRRPYREDDPPRPLSAYGRSKLAGEQAVLLAHDRALVVRSSWFYGPGRPGFVDKVVARAAGGGRFTVVNDQVGCPTYTRDLAAAILRLLEVSATGLVHAAGQGYASRLELARAAVELAGGDPGLVLGAATADLGSAAARPAFSALDSSRFYQLTGGCLPPWRESLARYLALNEEERE